MRKYRDFDIWSRDNFFKISPFSPNSLTSDRVQKWTIDLWHLRGALYYDPLQSQIEGYTNILIFMVIEIVHTWLLVKNNLLRVTGSITASTCTRSRIWGLHEWGLQRKSTISQSRKVEFISNFRKWLVIPLVLW